MVPWMPSWGQQLQANRNNIGAWSANGAWPAKGSWGKGQHKQQPWAMPQVQKPWLKQNQPYRATPWAPTPQWAPNMHQRKPPPSLPAHYIVDPNAQYTGTISFYHKWKGYGFIEVAQKGVVPQDRLFVHWRNIQSDDRFPFLVKGLEVEFGVLKWQDKFSWGLTTVRAKNVTLMGGTNIAMQDDVDAQEKTFVGGQHLRYTGTLKFFNPIKGFGYVTMDQGYDVDSSVPNDLRVETSEVNSGGKRPMPMQNVAVEFGIWIDAKGKGKGKGDLVRHKIYNMTLPGGHPLTQDALENRITMGPVNYQGTVAIWNWRHGWGFIRGDAHSVLPPRVVTKLAQQQQAAVAKGKRVSLDDKMFYFRRADIMQGCQPRRDMQVSFQVYIDDKGVGASEIIGLN